MLPTTKNLQLYRGDTFSMLIRFLDRTVDGQPGNPVALTGVTAEAQIRAAITSPTVITSFTCTLDAPNGTVTMKLSSSQTTTLAASTVYDLQLTFPDGTIQTFIQGTITMSGEVTHA